MTVPVRIGMIDHSGERSSTALHFAEPVDGNLAPIITETTGAYDVVKAAFIGLTAANLTRSTLTYLVDVSPGTLPADEHAQRELKLQIRYVDDVTGESFRIEVPAPQAGVIPSGTDVVPLTNVPLAAFITVFEGQCVTPRGNSLTVVGARIVGRNS